jgi:bacterioferritin
MMKGQEKIWALLNELLASELTAISQYMVHSEMDASWGYDKLHEMVEKRAITEMKHAETLIGRILFLEGQPVVSNLNQMHIGADVAKQLQNDRGAEFEAIRDYNAGSKLAAELGDYGTHQLLNSILKDEEAHIDEVEEQLDLISQMGLQNYLAQQLG